MTAAPSRWAIQIRRVRVSTCEGLARRVCGSASVLLSAGVAALAIVPAEVARASRPELFVRSCDTSIGPATPEAGPASKGLPGHSGRLLFMNLTQAGPPLQPIGPDGNHDGHYFAINWIVGVRGHDPLTITRGDRHALLVFRSTGSISVAKHDATRTVELRPCRNRAITVFNGSVMLLDHARCVPLVITDLRTHHTTLTTLSVGRHCPTRQAKA